MGGMGGDTGFPHPHMNGGPRKYQCKMCPQVSLDCFGFLLDHYDNCILLSNPFLSEKRNCAANEFDIKKLGRHPFLRLMMVFRNNFVVKQ